MSCNGRALAGLESNAVRAKRDGRCHKGCALAQWRTERERPSRREEALEGTFRATRACGEVTAWQGLRVMLASLSTYRMHVPARASCEVGIDPRCSAARPVDGGRSSRSEPGLTNPGPSSLRAGLLQGQASRPHDAAAAACRVGGAHATSRPSPPPARRPIGRAGCTQQKRGQLSERHRAARGAERRAWARLGRAGPGGGRQDQPGCRLRERQTVVPAVQPWELAAPRITVVIGGHPGALCRLRGWPSQSSRVMRCPAGWRTSISRRR